MKLLIKGVELNGVATDIYIENKYIKQIGPGLSVAADKDGSSGTGGSGDRRKA